MALRSLTVLYDPACGFCVHCRQWLESQPQIVPLEFLPAGSPAAAERFGDVAPGASAELTVIADDGAVYPGDRALIVCLWALLHYRGWALRLAQPAWRPHVRRGFKWLSKNRRDLSRLLHLSPEAADCGPEGCAPAAPAKA